MPKKIILNAKVLNPPKKKNQKKKNRSGRIKKRGKSSRRGSKLTPAGEAFLKCTMAPADFGSGTGFVGIPDEFDGDIVTKMHTSVTSLPSYTTGKDLYIVQLPIPGVAYFYGEINAGATTAIVLNAVFYSDSATLFPPGNETLNVSAFRLASNVIEIVPTVNDMTWSGAIQVSKFKVSAGDVGVSVNTGANFSQADVIEGMYSIYTQKPQSVFPLNKGCYVPSFNTEASYDFTDINEKFTFGNLSTNQSSMTSSNEQYFTFSGTTINYLGLGTFEATVIKFPAIAASQSAQVRCWSCVEYQVQPTSVLYDYRHMSPAYDPMALALLKAYHKQLPTAVDVAHNANFWETFRKWVRRAASVVSYVPGPVGEIAKATGSLMDLGHGLFD